jgi:SpoVK/Ycf46/Vps4 family AAA+-type ATPase
MARGEKTVKSIFKLAETLGSCVIFIDEADGLFRVRSSDEGRWYTTITNQFLLEWDGLSSKQNFVMMATNRPSDLDPAVLRRFQRQILVDLPKQEDRLEILKIHLRGEELGDNVDLRLLAKLTDSFSGSDIKNLCISAAFISIYEETYSANGVIKRTKLKAGGLRSQLAKNSNVQKRKLELAHFSKALKEAGQKMESSSLAGVRKWGEVYAQNSRRMGSPAA